MRSLGKPLLNVFTVLSGRYSRDLIKITFISSCPSRIIVVYISSIEFVGK